MRTLSSGLTLIVATAGLLAGCGGSIGYGNGTPTNVGTNNVGGGGTPADAGVVTAADAGTGGGGTNTQACSAAPFPTTWPFPNTAQAYQDRFWSPVQAAQTCGSSVTCHVSMGAGGAPVTPGSTADIPNNYMLAIQGMMTLVAGGGPNTLLATFHTSAAGAGLYTVTSPTFASIVPALQTLVTQMQDCAGCVAGTCNCANPQPYCTTP